MFKNLFMATNPLATSSIPPEKVIRFTGFGGETVPIQVAQAPVDLRIDIRCHPAAVRQSAADCRGDPRRDRPVQFVNPFRKLNACRMLTFPCFLHSFRLIPTGYRFDLQPINFPGSPATCRSGKVRA